MRPAAPRRHTPVRLPSVSGYCDDAAMEERTQASRKLTRQEISDSITTLGWRFILGVARTCVQVESLAQAAAVAERVISAADPDADECLWADVRADRLILSLQSLATAWVTTREIKLAHRISAVVSDLGLTTDADVGGGALRSVQVLEIAIDALDIAAIRPFWKAVMGYTDEAGHSGPQDAVVDPIGQCPAIWFQQMNEPRPQRNRIHFDISVPHDEAQRRIEAALAAGGTLVSEAEAPAFWALADAEGNEACITTWQGRDG
jgi:4a-hydroxytetrahydrobiopterin dehydratase